jgi:hypothetical protein
MEVVAGIVCAIQDKKGLFGSWRAYVPTKQEYVKWDDDVTGTAP